MWENLREEFLVKDTYNLTGSEFEIPWKNILPHGMGNIGWSLWSELKFEPTDILSRRHWYQNVAFLVPFNFYKGHILEYWTQGPSIIP